MTSSPMISIELETISIQSTNKPISVLPKCMNKVHEAVNRLDHHDFETSREEEFLIGNDRRRNIKGDAVNKNPDYKRRCEVLQKHCLQYLSNEIDVYEYVTKCSIFYIKN